MSNLPSDLPKRLRKYGLKVVEVPGWRTRMRPASTGGFAPVGVLCHDTVTSKASSDQSVVNLLVVGRSDLPGPLAQLGLARDGTVYIVAAGRSNHAGVAKPCGTVAGGDGNVLYIGIEAFNAGTGEPWNKVQYDAYVLLAAALCIEITGNSYRTVNGHKETSTEGKIDPSGPTPYEATFDMDAFRGRVAAKIKELNRKPKVRPAKAATLTVLGWNCYVANKDASVLAALEQWAKDHDPDVFCLSEANTHYDTIAKFCKANGYTQQQEKPAADIGAVVNDSGDTAILVRNDIHITHNWVADMLLKWRVTGHNKTHTPRHYEVAVLRKQGRKFRVRASHWPTHGFKGANKAAFLESARASRRWFRLAPFAVSVDVGDLNESVANVAAWFGKGRKVVGAGIDMLVARNAKTITHTQLDNGGSDHRAQLYVITVGKRS